MARHAATLRRVLIGATAALMLPATVTAQEGCDFGDDGNDVFVTVAGAGGEQITYVTNPHFVCEAGVQIWADSAVAYQIQGMSQLIGSVRYRDRPREMRSRQARYLATVGRDQAQGRRRVTIPE